jgi:hypothetical protein
MIFAAGLGVIAAAVVLGLGAVELNHALHAYPAQTWLGIAALLCVIFGMAAAKFRRSQQRVPLRPAAPEVPPLPKAIQAAPVLTAVASGVAAEEAQPCEGPGCRHKVDDDPYLARMPWETFDRRFCSMACVRAWEKLQVVPQEI